MAKHVCQLEYYISGTDYSVDTLDPADFLEAETEEELRDYIKEWLGEKTIALSDESDFGVINLQIPQEFIDEWKSLKSKNNEK